MEEVPEAIAEPPPSSLVLIVGAFFEPGELSTRELGGRRTALQEPAELCGSWEVRFLYFLEAAVCHGWQRPSKEKEK